MFIQIYLYLHFMNTLEIQGSQRILWSCPWPPFTTGTGFPVVLLKIHESWHCFNLLLWTNPILHVLSDLTKHENQPTGHIKPNKRKKPMDLHPFVVPLFGHLLLKSLRAPHPNTPNSLWQWKSWQQNYSNRLFIDYKGKNIPTEMDMISPFLLIFLKSGQLTSWGW